jgi:hypothetical protein
MIQQNKHIINTIVPLVVAGGVGYFMLKRKENIDRIAIYVIGSALICWAIVATLTKQAAKNAEADKIGDGINVPKSVYDTSKIITRLHDNIYCGLCQVDDALYLELFALLDQDLIVVAKDYFKKYNASLPEDINGEWWISNKTALANRFRTLNIY